MSFLEKLGRERLFHADGGLGRLEIHRGPCAVQLVEGVLYPPDAVLAGHALDGQPGGVGVVGGVPVGYPALLH